jgi:hypothetical protein
MENLLDFSGYLLESEEPKWEAGGILLIKGVPDANGKRSLFGARINKIVKANSGHYRAFVDKDMLYRIVRVDGNLTYRRIDFDYNKKQASLDNAVISLNDKNKKTPRWKETSTIKNINRILSDFFDDPSDWEDIKF